MNESIFSQKNIGLLIIVLYICGLCQCGRYVTDVGGAVNNYPLLRYCNTFISIGFNYSSYENTN